MELGLWDPSTKTTNAFKTFKFVGNLLLSIRFYTVPYMNDTNASAYALRAVLLQQQNHNNLSEWGTKAYWSKTVNQAEQENTAAKREHVAIVRAVQLLRSYINKTSVKC